MAKTVSRMMWTIQTVGPKAAQTTTRTTNTPKSMPLRFFGEEDDALLDELGTDEGTAKKRGSPSRIDVQTALGVSRDDPVQQDKADAQESSGA